MNSYIYITITNNQPNMKSFIGLALMAVLCSVELSQAAAPITNTLKVTDKNHLKKDDRDTEFICEFTTTETVVRVGIYKESVPYPIIEVTVAGTTFTKIDSKINTATCDFNNKDLHKATFSVNKLDAPALEGNYFCKVTIDADYPSSAVTVYSESEIATFDVTVKDALKDRSTEFNTGGQLDGACAYDIPVGETLTKLEILSADRVIATANKELQFTYPKYDGFTDVLANNDAASSKVVFTVKELTDKSAGEYSCRYTVEDGSVIKITKVIVSNVIMVTHAGDPTITGVMLTIADKNHVKNDDRVTNFDCTFTKIKDQANIVVNVVKTDEKPAFTLFTVDATGSTFNQLSGRIMVAEFDKNNKDGQKTIFTLKKAGAPQPNGVYRCDVHAPGASTVSSKTVIVYTNSGGYNSKNRTQTIRPQLKQPSLGFFNTTAAPVVRPPPPLQGPHLIP
ncbi:unnamed protein product [Medioppia subpectinata]|uniref:Ig-like domain-containing protein n=1 Tax=Medioppia subpectinata TaxID=1979941 RepID=A0A7R9KQG7_9ACAR|nr:unnamed protein product [Medioppia subpectinata]CAG2107928.1 unnamed protein product [Medioppia subpectinata]